MRVETIPSARLRRDGRRLDCRPYMVSGALEAKLRLEELSCAKVPLRQLAAGHEGGIYNGPHFPRTFVDSTEHGVPFLGSSAMLRADLNGLPLLRRRDATSPKLSFLQLRAGMTLISCSGTIGRMVYARPDMESMWTSQHIMKVAPDPERVRPGYVYAFLSSKFGLPLVVSGTYGSIIQSIEPQHIADLPVPRLGDVIESAVHALMEESASSLAESAALYDTATSTLLSQRGLADSRDAEWRSDKSRLGWTETSISHESFRAFNYDPRAARYRNAIQSGRYDELGELCEPANFRGKIIFKRIDALPVFGVLLVGQREAFQLRPEGRWISRKSIDGLGLQVPAGTVLVPSHGTLGEYELYCRAVFVTDRTSRFAFSGDFFRCIPIRERVPPGYLFAFLRSRIAFRLLRSISTGGKQQEQHIHMMRRFPIPRLSKTEEGEIAQVAERAAHLYDRALGAEDEARSLLERAIEEAS